MPPTREIINLLRDLRDLSREPGGGLIGFALDLLIKDLELVEMYGGEVPLRSCPRYSVGAEISERYYSERESTRVDAVLPE